MKPTHRSGTILFKDGRRKHCERLACTARELLAFHHGLAPSSISHQTYIHVNEKNRTVEFCFRKTRVVTKPDKWEEFLGHIKQPHNN